MTHAIEAEGLPKRYGKRRGILDLEPLIDTGAYPPPESALYLALGFGGGVLALLALRRRDLAA